MAKDLNQLDIHSLQAIFVEKNRVFAEAMRKNNAHSELVMLYKEIEEVYRIYQQKKQLKNSSRKEIYV